MPSQFWKLFQIAASSAYFEESKALLLSRDMEAKRQIEENLDTLYNYKRPYHREAHFRFDERALTEQWRVQSKRDLIEHPHWPILKVILVERSLIQEEYLSEKEFFPPPHTNNTLYVSQLQTLSQEYEKRKNLFEKWLDDQVGAPFELHISIIRNILLAPINIYFRRKIELVHQHSIRGKSMLMNPLKNCMSFFPKRNNLSNFDG
jgi:hypothetical protein